MNLRQMQTPMLWCFSLGLIALHLLKHTLDDAWLGVRLINYGYEFLLLTSLFALILLIVKKSLISVALSLPLIFFLLTPYIVTGSNNGKCVGQSLAIKVLTFNVLGRNNDYTEIIKVITKHKPDVLFVQELTDIGDFSSKLISNQYLADYHVISRRESGLAIYSRFPIQKEKNRSNFLKGRLFLEGNDIALLNIHSIRSVKNYSKYNAYMQGLFNSMANEESLIVAGDFNMVPYNTMYHKMLEQKVTDSFSATNSFGGYTFPGPARKIGSFFPFVRIDYIFTSNNICILDSYNDTARTESDHYPVVSIIGL